MSEPQRKSLLAVLAVPFSDSWEQVLKTYLEVNHLINEQIVIKDYQGETLTRDDEGVEPPGPDPEKVAGILSKQPSREQFPLKIYLKRMEVIPDMMLGSDYREGDLVEVIVGSMDGSRPRELLEVGTVLRVVLTDQAGDIRYSVFGKESEEGWIKKKNRSTIRLFAKVPTAGGRNVETLEEFGGQLVYAQCSNCLEGNPEAFLTPHDGMGLPPLSPLGGAG